MTVRYILDEIPVDVQQELETLRNKLAFLESERDQIKAEMRIKAEQLHDAQTQAGRYLHYSRKLANKVDVLTEKLAKLTTKAARKERELR